MQIVRIITNVDLNPPLAGVPITKTMRIQNGIAITRIPSGMDTGRSAVGITAELPDGSGRHVFIEITMRNFQTAAEIFKSSDEQAGN